jgi:excisionase family DNA binding protein
MSRNSAKSQPPLSYAPAFQLPVSRKSLTKRELARELRISVRTIDSLMQQKKIPFKKISPRLVRFDLDRVERTLDRYTVREVS